MSLRRKAGAGYCTLLQSDANPPGTSLSSTTTLFESQGNPFVFERVGQIESEALKF